MNSSRLDFVVVLAAATALTLAGCSTPKTLVVKAPSGFEAPMMLGPKVALPGGPAVGTKRVSTIEARIQDFGKATSLGNSIQLWHSDVKSNLSEQLAVHIVESTVFVVREIRAKWVIRQYFPPAGVGSRDVISADLTVDAFEIEVR
jgi:hypothetical protein